MVRYARDGVLFVGYDSTGVAQNVTRRAIAPTDSVQKRDLHGSDKRYPPILSGDQKTVWIVEGGADALALHDLYKRRGKQPSTVLVSGGANVRGFLERPEIQTILKRADRVIIASENEKNAKVQTRTEASHRKQAERVFEITGRAVKSWKPKPNQGKDLADVNDRQQQTLKPVQLMNPNQQAGTKPSRVMDSDFT